VYDIETVSLRFCNAFGPRQDPSAEYAAVIPRFITGMIAG
jgi:nucleoside-diphosphate-sugar epimerase